MKFPELRTAVMAFAALTPAFPAELSAQPPGNVVGPPAPVSLATQEAVALRDGPLPATLTLAQALEEAEARSPALAAARARVRAAEGRLRQAGARSNPELSVEVENFLGSGDFAGVRGVETTVAVNQRLDLGGRRGARSAVARAELAEAQLRLAIARADLVHQVREHFARAATARDRLRLAEDAEARARELARIAGQLVDAGRDPPLRAVRARSAAAQAEARLQAARAEERAARSTLAALFGAATPPENLSGPLIDLDPRTIDPEQSLEVRLADAEQAAAEAGLRREQVATRLDPSVGLGVRHSAETGDVGLVSGVSMPLPIFDRNRGNIDAARADIDAAEARRAAALAAATVRARNAILNVEAAQAQVAALEGAAVPAAFEALTLAQASYREGRASLIELLDAQNAYDSAQSDLLDARLALALATAELGRVAAQ